MSEETTLTVRPDAPIEWGNRSEIAALGDRLKTMFPGKLSNAEALLLAQYSAAMDANPFRGEVYAYPHRGKIVLVEGYKLLVRWARRQCNFYERYERITNDTDTLPEDAIAFRCRILREDALPALTELTNAGVPNAYEIVSTEAVGVVTKADRTTKQDKPQSPPTGWTWEEVARKRALKNALNRAYGSPSPREIAEETWRGQDTWTIPDDWEDVTPTMIPAEREALALANAREREREPLGQTVAESMADLGFGDDPFETPRLKPLEPESAEGAVEIPPGLPETPQEAPGKGSPWNSRTALINQARKEIGYYGDNAYHIIGALKKLEGAGTITWEMDDEAVFGALNLYARQRADQKAAEEAEKPARPARRKKEEML